MRLKFTILFSVIFSCFVINIKAQNDLKNGITKPNIVSAHPLGNFFTRGQGNFKFKPTENTLLHFTLESGNIWASPLTTYIPLDEDIRSVIKERVWHTAEFAFDEETLNAETIELKFDGVVKGLKFGSTFKIGEAHELNISTRMYLLTQGKSLFSPLTGDDFVEWFHDKIAGGEDPFARKLFGLNQAEIYYKDRNGNSIELNKGDFFVGGIESNYYYYPEALSNKDKLFSVNFGAHLGTNLSKYNSSIDLGVSANGVKQFKLSDTRYFNLGLGLGSIRKSVIDFKSDNIDLGSNEFLGYLESALEFNLISKGGTIHSIGADFYLQTSLNNKDEFDYLIPIRNGVSEKSWFNGMWHLYKNNNYWTLLYSFTKKVTTTFYLQQDLTVNNNPDIQTGVSVSFKI